MQSYGELIYENLKLSPRPNKRLVLEQDYKILDVKIHKGYTTNGADVPRFLWCFLPPNNTDILPAVILHDYLCSQANIMYENNKDKDSWYKYRTYANDMFYKALDLLDYKHKNILYKAVNLYTKWQRLWL